MKTRFPLSAKILLWFFLNLVLLGLVALLVLRGQLRFSLDLLMAGRGGERMQGFANVIASELTERPREEWDEILRRFGEGYGLQLALFRPDGGFVAGEKLDFPAEVIERLRERPNLPPQRGIGPRNGPSSTPASPLPRQLGDRTAADVELDHRENLAADEPARVRQPVLVMDQPNPPARPRFAAPGPPQNRSRFLMRSAQPTRYWVGVQLPQLEPQRPQARLTLLAVSPSIRGGGLFVDYTPWLLAAGAVIVLSVLFWLPLVRGITRALAQLTRATGEIAEGRFEVRVPEQRRDELGALAAAVNRMAARLAGFVTGQKRFLGDTAHELCAPLARMQMALGILEQRADEKQKPYVNDVREELQHISALVNELLSFSKAGLRKQPAALQSVALAEIAARVAEREGKAGGAIEVNVDPQLQVMAEPELLSRALANLVRNAFRYAGDAGPVRVTAMREDANVIVAVSDEGPGVPEDALQKIFDPFYRVEESRSRETGGVGLGLAIVRTCVEACDGSVAALNRQPRGLEVRIALRAA